MGVLWGEIEITMQYKAKRSNAQSNMNRFEKMQRKCTVMKQFNAKKAMHFKAMKSDFKASVLQKVALQ
jgi:hypothetical protein